MAQIPEHQPIVKSPVESMSGIPSNEDPDVKLVLDLFSSAKQYKDEITQDWDKRWQFYNDQQWDAKRPKNRSDASINIIKIAIQTMLPILTDARPGFNVLPEEPTDFEFAKALGMVTESWWLNSDMDQTLVETIMDSMIYDAGIMKVMWDPDLLNGIGDIRVDVIDPRDIYLPPTARDFNKGCTYVIQKIKKPVGELRRKFPEHKDKIKADTTESSQDTFDSGDKSSTGINSVTLVSPVDRKSDLAQKSTSSTSTDTRQECTILECWIDDDTVEEYEVEKDDGTKEQGTKEKYPNGRLITILPSKKLLLQSSENPYKHGLKPFVRIVDGILPRRFWGDGEVKQLMSVQQQLNKVLANIIDYMNFTSNPLWLVETGSGLDTSKITNTYGLILKVNDGGINKVKREIPPPLPQYIISFYEQLKSAADSISGIHDVTQGRKPAGVTAASAIETLQEAAQTRIRLKERNLQTSLSQLGRQVVQLIMQYYTQPRVARITNSQAYPEFFDFYVEPQDDGTVRFNKREWNYNENTEQYVPDIKWQQSETSKGVFDVKVLSGTALPYAKATRSQLALQLFDRKALDVESLLDTLEWPDKSKVLNKLQEQNQQQAQQGQPPA